MKATLSLILAISAEAAGESASLGGARALGEFAADIMDEFGSATPCQDERRLLFASQPCEETRRLEEGGESAPALTHSAIISAPLAPAVAAAGLRLDDHFLSPAQLGHLLPLAASAPWAACPDGSSHRQCAKLPVGQDPLLLSLLSKFSRVWDRLDVSGVAALPVMRILPGSPTGQVHRDALVERTDKGKAAEAPQANNIIYLTNATVGLPPSSAAATSFPDLRTSVMPVAGRMLSFPGSVRHFVEALAPGAPPRYTMMIPIGAPKTSL